MAPLFTIRSSTSTMHNDCSIFTFVCQLGTTFCSHDKSFANEEGLLQSSNHLGGVFDLCLLQAHSLTETILLAGDMLAVDSERAFLRVSNVIATMVVQMQDIIKLSRLPCPLIQCGAAIFPA